LLDLLVESLGGFPEGPFFILLGVPAGRNAPETPIFLFRRPAGRSTLPGVPEGLSCFRSARSVSGFQREFLLFHKDFW
ncbi:hypothetical protein, partial [Bifidobacterium catenulatum]|uniref:hypothetical protein n=1 Tax=Bifidobacterium catenulatum TaxID=1686 RepID=UPI00247FB457